MIHQQPDLRRRKGWIASSSTTINNKIVKIKWINRFSGLIKRTWIRISVFPHGCFRDLPLKQQKVCWKIRLNYEIEARERSDICMEHGVTTSTWHSPLHMCLFLTVDYSNREKKILINLCGHWIALNEVKASLLCMLKTFRTINGLWLILVDYYCSYQKNVNVNVRFGLHQILYIRH